MQQPRFALIVSFGRWAVSAFMLFVFLGRFNLDVEVIIGKPVMTGLQQDPVPRLGLGRKEFRPSLLLEALVDILHHKGSAPASVLGMRNRAERVGTMSFQDWIGHENLHASQDSSAGHRRAEGPEKVVARP